MPQIPDPNTDLFLELTKAWSPFIVEHALPLFAMAREHLAADPHMRALGTGSLLLVEDSLYLVSAAHVFHELNKGHEQTDDLAVVRGPAPNQTPVVVSGRLFVHPEPHWDLAALRLEPDTCEKFRAFPILDLENIAMSPAVGLEWGALAGWFRPATGVTVSDGVKLYRGEPLVLGGFLNQVPSWLPPEYLHLGIDVTEAEAPRGMAVRLPLHFGGISGAPLWSLASNRDDDGRPLVIGFQTNVIPDGSRRFVRATPVRELLRMVAALR